MSKLNGPECCGQESVYNEVLGEGFFYCRICKHETTDIGHTAREAREEAKPKKKREIGEPTGFYNEVKVQAWPDWLSSDDKIADDTTQIDFFDSSDPWIDSASRHYDELIHRITSSYISKQLPYDPHADSTQMTEEGNRTHWYKFWKEYE